jgi:iron complex outermembrane recepter protein
MTFVTDHRSPTLQRGCEHELAPRTRRNSALVCAAVWSIAACPRAAWSVGTEAATAAEQTVVISTTPLAGLGMPLNRVPANVQTINPSAGAGRAALSMADVLDHTASSVNLNDAVGNPFQPDLNFRGFTASPALGTPQGLSVFVDGVRVNEAFGDTVNWDLIPAAAISGITVIPGSDPVFGLNSLGGALSVSTKTGFDDPGVAMKAYGGSFGRVGAEFTAGGHARHLGWLVSGNSVHDTGWSRENPSRVQQLYATGGYRDSRTQAAASVTLADTRLGGNQTLPLSFMSDVRQAYTYPDSQANRLTFVNLKLRHNFSDRLLVEGNVYYRKLLTRSLNSNVNNDFDPGQPAGPGNQPTANLIDSIDQDRPGASLQLSELGEAWGRPNQWIAGLTLDRGRTRFTQSDQEAGASRDTTSSSPLVLSTSLRSTSTTASAYASDSLGIASKTFVTLSGRYDQFRLRLDDRLGTALNGDHSFHRLNPAVGITYSPAASLTVYAAYNEGMRVPTPVELSCADPSAPCSLPNAFASDPALEPVLSRTIEAGARGRVATALNWSAAAFRTLVVDDIQFISSGGGATSAGYFRNVGRTRRQGLELALEGDLGRFRLSLQYSLMAATFESRSIINSPSNSTAAPLGCAACNDIEVEPGDRMPGIPRHIVKASVGYAPSDSASITLSMLGQSAIYARGDENNRDINGPVPGFAVFDLNANCRLTGAWDLFVKATNLFDRRYATFGTLGQNVFTAAGNRFDSSGASWRNEQFRSVAAPRGVWIGLTYRTDRLPE